MQDVTFNEEPCVYGPLEGPPEYSHELLTFRDVNKQFGDKVVLRGLELHICNIKNKPQIVCICGNSGGGKTTANRLLAGLEQPTSGEVLVSGGTELRPVKAGDVGMVFQKYPVWIHKSVLENIIDPGVKSGKSRKDAEAKARELLKEVGLEDHSDSWPVDLSGGQQQRVAIAMQLMVDRYYMVFDEPFASLDPLAVDRMIKIIARVAYTHTRRTFVIATHNIASALVVADHIYLLGRERDSQGQVVPGSVGNRIVRSIDLISEGLAYHPDIERLPRFHELHDEIKYGEFPKL